MEVIIKDYGHYKAIIGRIFNHPYDRFPMGLMYVYIYICLWPLM